MNKNILRILSVLFLIIVCLPGCITGRQSVPMISQSGSDITGKAYQVTIVNSTGYAVLLGLSDADVTIDEIIAYMDHEYVAPPFWASWHLSPILDHSGFPDDRIDRSRDEIVIPAGTWKLVAAFYRQDEIGVRFTAVTYIDLTIDREFVSGHGLAEENAVWGNKLKITVTEFAIDAEVVPAR